MPSEATVVPLRRDQRRKRIYKLILMVDESTDAWLRKKARAAHKSISTAGYEILQAVRDAERAGSAA